MKKIKLLCLLFIIIIMTGCSSGFTAKNAQNISYKIYEYIKNDYKPKGLSKEEKEIFDDFIESTKEENYVVNLSEVYTFDMTDWHQLNDSNNEYVYEENGDYKIKYSDIEWTQYEYGSYATIKFDESYHVLYKSYVPLLNEETKDNDNYLYILDFTNVESNKIESYYKSLNGVGGMIIRYNLDGKNLRDISVIFEPEYSGKKEEKKPKIAMNIIFAIVLLTMVAGFAYIIIKFMRRF